MKHSLALILAAAAVLALSACSKKSNETAQTPAPAATAPSESTATTPEPAHATTPEPAHAATPEPVYPGSSSAPATSGSTSD